VILLKIVGLVVLIAAAIYALALWVDSWDDDSDCTDEQEQSIPRRIFVERTMGGWHAGSLLAWS